MANNELTIPIPARLKNVAKGGHVAGTKDIIDDALGKEQNEINQERIDDIAEVKGGSTKSIADISEDIAAETERASGVEAGLRESIDELGQIGLNPENAISTDGDDFNGDTTAKRSKIPTIGAIIDGNPGVYDVSKRNPTGGPNSDGKFTLEYILANVDTLIPTSRRYGGMEICFVHNSDNKYVQYFLTKDEWSASGADWEKINIENDVQDIIGNYTENVDESKTTEMELSSNMVLLWEIDTKIKIGQDYQVSVLGSFGKNRVRIYANDNFSSAIYSDDTGSLTNLIASQNINKLSYYANCTSVGDSVCTLKYSIPAYGIKENIEDSQNLIDSHYLLHCIVGGKGPTFNNWVFTKASLFSFNSNNFTAYKGNGIAPSIEKNINVQAGKKYYVLCELDITSLHSTGVKLIFSGLKYKVVRAHLGKNIIFFEVIFDAPSSIYTFLQFRSVGTSQEGDALITAECLYFSVIETDNIEATYEEIKDASEENLYIPKYINNVLVDSQYLLHCIVGGKGPTFNNWGTNVASLFSFSGNNFTAYRGNGLNPDIEKTINVVAGKRYYVLCELNISSLHESGVTLNFRGLKYESVQAQLGKNTIFYEATFDEAASVFTYLQFSPNGTSQTGDVIITAECLYFSVIETEDVNVTDKVIEQASERDVYVPKYINGLTLGGKWVALGDSLTGQRKYIPNTVKKMGFDSVLNLGVGGKKASGEDGMWKTDYLSQIPNDASLITLMCGTNDWAQSVVIGDIDSTDTDEYCGALNTIIDYISQNYPQIRFVMMCPPIGVYPNRTGWSAPWIENINGNSMMDFAEAAYQVASNRGIPCARIGQNVGWNDKNISTFITFDGAYLHPNELGGLRISDVLVGFLKTILPL